MPTIARARQWPIAWGIDRSETGFINPGEYHPKVIDLKAACAEFMAMTLFVIIGCGTACKAIVSLSMVSDLLTTSQVVMARSTRRLDTW